MTQDFVLDRMAPTEWKAPTDIGAFGRRLADVAVAGPVLLAGAPLIAALALAVWVRDPGASGLYRQERTGLDGRPFALWKIRTMKAGADGRPFAARKTADDPRILGHLGRALRRLSLDELPQFWNVLRGEMTLVGPRPLPPEHHAMLSESFRARRTQVKPGLTGLWQVEARGRGDARTLEAFDGAYLAQRGFLFDTWILARTVGAVLTGRGAC